MFISQRFFYDAAAPVVNGTGGNNEVIKTKEQIDKQNEFRKTQGLEALPYPTAQATTQPAPAAATEPSALDKFRKTKEQELTDNNTAGLSEEEIRNEAEKLVRAEADKIKSEQQSAAEEARKLAEKEGSAPSVIKIAAKVPVKEADKPATEEDKQETEVDDAALLKALSKKTGKEIKSLDEFINPIKELTSKEKEVQVQERETAKLNFALQNKKISKAEVESYIEDSKNPQQVAYNYYAATQKELDSTLTGKEIRESFEETYGLNEKEDSLIYKLGQKQIEFIANSIIANKHAKYLGLENEYVAFENSQASTANYQKDILSKAPAYKKDVEAVVAKLQKVTIGGYEVELTDVLDGYKQKMLTPEYTEKIIAKGYSLDEIEGAIKTSAIIDNLDIIIDGILGADRLKNQAGLRGIIPPNKKEPAQVVGEVANENLRQLRAQLGIVTN